MKTIFKIKLLWLFLFLGSPLIAQDMAPCGTIATAEQIHYLNETRELRQQFNRSNGNMIWIPVQVHIITQTSGGGALSNYSINQLMGSLNTEYRSANIQFYYCSNPNYIASDSLFNFDYDLHDSILSSQYDVSNVMNVYFTGSIGYNGGGLCGYAFFPGGPDHLVVANSCTYDDSTFLHEWGHAFTLYHTHGKTNSGTTDELVNGSNCTVAGDDVCDTPADPNLWQNTSGCSYVAGQTDINGQVYMPDVSNIMSYAPPSCRNSFSVGQDNRMTYSALNDRPYLGCGVQPACANEYALLNNPYFESFENGLGGWQNYTDAYATEYGYTQFEFVLNSGTTPTPNTGPSSASNGNTYLLAEATGHVPNQAAFIKSPCFDFSNVLLPKLSIESHQFGLDAGQFVLQASVDGGYTWGTPLLNFMYDRGNQWNQDEVDLSAYANQRLVQFRIAVLTSNGEEGDIAIDAIQVWDDNIVNCPPSGTACDDNNPSTFNDVEDGNCNCLGTPCPPAGTACNDNNPNTINDVEDGFCNCQGTVVPTCSETVINFNNFDSNWGIWSDGGSDCRRSSSDAAYAYSGNYCIRLQDNTSTSVMTTSALDLTSFEEITVSFTYITASMDNANEDFWLQISSNGSSYTTVEEWNRDDEFVNNSREFDAVTIQGPFTANTRLRFRCDASDNNDWVYIDDVEIKGCQLQADPFQEPGNNTMVEGNTQDLISTTVILSPNPAKEQINVNLIQATGTYTIEVFTLTGQRMINRLVTAQGLNTSIPLDVSSLARGIYIVRVDSGKGFVYKRFILE
ncbi:MAG: T9SS type A sorting domain-containing protein [Flavobacteriaceae bacterium]